MIPNFRNQNLLASILITIYTIFAYQGVLHNGFVSYDDLTYLFENEHIRAGLSVNGMLWAFTSSYDANWIPITWLSHMADMSIFGTNPFGHHLVNLLLHTACALLLQQILVSMTGAVWRSAAVAALFALHPLHVESVAWAAERKDVLSALFFMLTITMYLRYAAERTLARYLSVMALYACGLAAKSMLVSLPFVLLLLDSWPLRRFASATTSQDNSTQMGIPSLILEKLPLIFLSLASCAITFIVQRKGGAVNDMINSPFSENAAHAMFNYVTYLSKTFWPSGLAVLYPYVHELSVWQVGGAIAFLTLLTILVIWQWNSRPYLTVGWLWFLITMVPVIGFVRIGVHSIADRYTYLPLIGIFIMVVWELANFLEFKRYGSVIAALLAITVFSTLSVATWKQTGYWKDSITLYEHALNTTEDNWLIHNNLGTEMTKRGMSSRAIWHFKEAVRIMPDYATSHQNLGSVLRSTGDTHGAIRAYQSAQKLNPNLADPYHQLGILFSRLGDNSSALEACEALERINPVSAQTLRALLTTGDHM